VSVRVATLRAGRAAIAATVVFCSPALAQPAFTGAGAGIAYESYFFSASDDVALESLSLVTVPVMARVALARSLRLELSSAWARGAAELPDGSETTISGPTDTELRLTFDVGRDLLSFTGIALLPTGVETLSTDEANVAGLIAADVLPFRITNWGTGGGIGASTAIARPFGDFAAGLSVGYVVAQEFQPLAEDEFQYRPGSQLHVRAALDRVIGDAGKVALVLTLQRFQSDEIDGDNLFQTGNRYQATGSYAFAAGAAANAIVYAGYLRRDEGDFAEEPSVLPAQDLFFGGAGLEWPLGRALVRPAVDVRVLRRADGTEQGYTATVGGSADVPVGSLTLAPTARGRFGNVLLRDQAESGFSGVELSLTLRFGSPR
jgi:hypothetical protein